MLFLPENEISNSTILKEYPMNIGILNLYYYIYILISELEEFQKLFGDSKISNSDLLIKENDPSNLIILADDNHIINNCNKNIISEILNESQRNYFKIIVYTMELILLDYFLTMKITVFL